MEKKEKYFILCGIEEPSRMLLYFHWEIDDYYSGFLEDLSGASIISEEDMNKNINWEYYKKLDHISDMIAIELNLDKIDLIKETL